MLFGVVFYADSGYHVHLHENQCFGSQNLGIRVELSNIKPLISKS
jgi:hypothetical protein